DAASGEPVRSCIEAAGEQHRAVFAPGGRLLALILHTRSPVAGVQVLVFDLVSSAVLRRLEGGADEYAGLAFAPDGKTLYAASARGVLRSWDVRTGREKRSPAGPT